MRTRSRNTRRERTFGSDTALTEVSGCSPSQLSSATPLANHNVHVSELSKQPHLGRILRVQRPVGQRAAAVEGTIFITYNSRSHRIAKSVVRRLRDVAASPPSPRTKIRISLSAKTLRGLFRALLAWLTLVKLVVVCCSGTCLAASQGYIEVKEILVGSSASQLQLLRTLKHRALLRASLLSVNKMQFKKNFVFFVVAAVIASASAIPVCASVLTRI